MHYSPTQIIPTQYLEMFVQSRHWTHPMRLLLRFCSHLIVMARVYVADRHAHLLLLYVVCIRSCGSYTWLCGISFDMWAYLACSNNCLPSCIFIRHSLRIIWIFITMIPAYLEWWGHYISDNSSTCKWTLEGISRWFQPLTFKSHHSFIHISWCSASLYECILIWMACNGRWIISGIGFGLPFRHELWLQLLMQMHS